MPPATHGDQVASPSAFPVRVVPRHGELVTVAARALAPGDVVMRLLGIHTDRPTRYSIQLDEHVHLDLPDGMTEERMQVDYPWRFLEHACAPNAVVRGDALVALQPIAAGDVVTFDYHTTEYDMAAPFACRCGARDCVGTVRGFRHLPPARQLRLAPHLRPWLRRHLQGHTAG